MTVQPENLVDSRFAEKEYNVTMAGTILAVLLPLLVHFVRAAGSSAAIAPFIKG